MSPDQFRKIALSMPDTEERSHMDHPDFRFRGKIFASLWPDGATAMIKLPPEKQRELIVFEPTVFRPAQGAWGKQGCTLVDLKSARTPSLRAAMTAAYQRIAGTK